MRKFLLSAAMALLLAACAGTPVDWGKARSVSVGMSEAQLIERMGKPYMVTSRGADQIWVYSHANAFGGARSVSYIIRDGKVAGVPTIPESFK